MEKTAPNGYTVAEKISFKVNEDGSISLVGSNGEADGQVVTMRDASIDLSISKKAVNGTDELPGAQLILKKQGEEDSKAIDSWTSTTTEHKVDFSKLTVGETYTLVEKTAPKGYTVAEEISFKVNKDGSITRVGANGDVNGQVVTMKDAATKVYISKVSITNSKELAGATLFLKDADGNIAKDSTGADLKWVSTNEKKLIEMLPTGTYTLVEETAPYGYKIAESITFTVETDGRITIAGKDVGDTVVMVDQVKTSGGTSGGGGGGTTPTKPTPTDPTQPGPGVPTEPATPENPTVPTTPENPENPGTTDNTTTPDVPDYPNHNVIITDGDVPRFSGRTDENGHIDVDLGPGTYNITILDDDGVPLANYTLTIPDEPVPLGAVKAGDHTLPYALLITVLLAALGSTGIIIKKRKELMDSEQ